jgi:DNA polymerase
MNQGSDTERNARRQQYLDTMGILRWQLREPQLPASAGQVKDADAPALSEADSAGKEYQDIAMLDWEALRSRVSECTACDLHASRTQTVFGVGNQSADWLVIGEAPGADEDAQGEPFVGRAGQLLNAMLLACGLKREQVYIANILKCRPPNNRDPRPEEVASCEPYLMRQIELIQPKLILAVGRIAAQNLLQCDTPIGKLRGKVHRFRDTGIPLVATYHPAYLLRSPAEKRKAWQDLQLAMQVMREASS